MKIETQILSTLPNNESLYTRELEGELEAIR